jgi:parallel beta-helix repeat protein
MEDNIFFVSANGSDAWSGTLPDNNKDKTDGPFASLQRAKQAVCSLKKAGLNKGAVTVFMRGGLYALRKPVIFTPEDSGTDKVQIRYTSYENERPVISGGRKINKWERGTAGLWSADASDIIGKDSVCRQLFINGCRRPRASMPSEGFFLVDGVLPATGLPLEFKFRKGDIKEDWADENAEILILENWYELRHRVRSIDGGKREIKTYGVSRTNQKPGQRYRLENIKKGLEQSGSWYFDKTTGTIYYHPLAGEEMNRIDAFVAVLDSLLIIEGRADDRLKNIHFTGITFRNTAWRLPEEGYNDKQAAFDIPAAVKASYAQGCIFENCLFTNLGGYAVEWGAGCINNCTIGCEITDTGAGGIKIGTAKTHDNQSDSKISAGNEINDCHIHDIGIVYPAAVGIWIGQSCNNVIARNHIHDTYYSGISVGWTWGYGISNAYGNIIEYNHLHDIAREMLSDLGAIYLLGLQPGTVIRNNVIHDIASYEFNGYGIYLDEGTGGVLIENNLVYRTRGGGFFQHYGKENIIQNNIFAFAKEGQLRRSMEEQHLSFIFRNNIVYCKDEYPFYGTWTNNQYIFENNIYFRETGSSDNFVKGGNIILALKEFRSNFLGECERFDTVRINPCAAETEGTGETRHLGRVPFTDKPRGVYPEEKSWQKALLLPELVTQTGQKIKKGETETRMIRDGEYLYVSIEALYSKYSAGQDGDKESVEIFLKPDISNNRNVQFFLTIGGTKTTYYRPAETWQAFQWDGQVVQKGKGWRALFRIPINKIDNSVEKGKGLWQIFVARQSIEGLPDKSFQEWRKAGQDKNSIFADPLFIDPDNNDFTLKKESPVFNTGFQPFKFKR